VSQSGFLSKKKKKNQNQNQNQQEKGFDGKYLNKLK